MRSVGLRELRLNGRAVIERAKAGETLEITDRGRPVARIIPISSHGTYSQMVADGRVRVARGDLLHPRPPPSSAARPTLTELLMAERDSYYEDSV